MSSLTGFLHPDHAHWHRCGTVVSIDMLALHFFNVSACWRGSEKLSHFADAVVMEYKVSQIEDGEVLPCFIRGVCIVRVGVATVLTQFTGAGDCESEEEKRVRPCAPQ